MSFYLQQIEPRLDNHRVLIKTIPKGKINGPSEDLRFQEISDAHHGPEPHDSKCGPLTTGANVT